MPLISKGLLVPTPEGWGGNRRDGEDGSRNLEAKPRLLLLPVLFVPSALKRRKEAKATGRQATIGFYREGVEGRRFLGSAERGERLRGEFETRAGWSRRGKMNSTPLLLDSKTGLDVSARLFHTPAWVATGKDSRGFSSPYFTLVSSFGPARKDRARACVSQALRGDSGACTEWAVI